MKTETIPGNPDAEDGFKGLLLPHRPSHIVTAYLFFIFSFPFNAGSVVNLIAFTCLLVLFISSVFFTTRNHPVSLLAQTRDSHPVFFWLLIAFLISSGISLLKVFAGEVTKTQQILTIWRYMIYILIAGYTVALARLCMVYQLSHAKIFFSFVLGMTTLTLLQLLVYHFGPTPNADTWFFHPPLGHHIRDTGNMAEISAVAGISFLLYMEKPQPRLLLLVGFSTLACWTFILWAGGRAGIVAAIIASLAIICMAKIHSKTALKRIILIIALCSLSFPLSNALSVFPWNGIKRVSEIMEAPAEIIDSGNTDAQLLNISNQFTTGRIVIWSFSLDAVSKSPWFGTGPYGYFFIPDKPGKEDNPHNLIIQFLVEWGIIGTALLVAILAYMAWHGLKKLPLAFREKDISYIICAGTVLTLTLNGLVTGTYFMLQPLFCLATAFAAFPFAKIRRQQTGPTDKPA